MNKVQLYIDNNLVDLFKDETINITQSIQNVKDPAKVFTEFSKTLTVPASKANNKIFKHYYNYDITNGFDARLKTDAEIKLNYVQFKLGFIQLNTVELRENIPYAYKITFFGSTVTLKDVLGENQLSSLTWLNAFGVEYSSEKVEAYLQDGFDATVEGVSYNDVVLSPLITHTTRLFYDSSPGHAADVNGNVYYDNASGHDHGVLWSELKYSLRVHAIIKAIEATYEKIKFSDDFFDVNNDVWHNLYLWMHRKKGDYQSTVTGVELFSKLVNNFEVKTFFPNLYATNTSINNFTSSNDTVNFNINFQVADDTKLYNIILTRFNIIYRSEFGLTGDFNLVEFNLPFGYYELTVQSTTDFVFDKIIWGLTGTVNGQFFNDDTIAEPVNIQSITLFEPTQQIPEIKIIDFLTGIFKMFNLTAFVKDGIIVVDTLDNFYETYNLFDISEYVSTDKKDVDSALPYKEIIFGFADYKTFFASIYNQLSNKQFGELKYNADSEDNFIGGIYKIVLPFQKMLYEKLTDVNADAPTDIQVGWMADDNQNSYLGKPLLHYVHKVTAGTELSFKPNQEDHKALTTYYVPLNANGITGADQTLNFGSEKDEYANSQNNESLFENFYLKYIQGVFNKKRRITNITAFLPLKILLKYTLNDRFVLNGKAYKINNIDTNLQTGESKLELLNEL